MRKVFVVREKVRPIKLLAAGKRSERTESGTSTTYSEKGYAKCQSASWVFE